MWYFLLIANLITPLVMIGFGKSFMKSAPKSLNDAFGLQN